MALTVEPTFLADTSALARLDRPQVAARLGPLLVAGKVATCGTAMLELLYTARPGRDYIEGAEMLQSLPRAPMDDAVMDRALHTQASLASSAQHRGAALPDLLLAATAAGAGLTVLHYDSDFDRIAAVTEQDTEWVVPQGSVD